MSGAEELISEIRKAAQKAPRTPKNAVLLDRRDPMKSARRFWSDRYTDSHHAAPTLYGWRGELRRWTGTHYAEMEEAALRAELYEYLEVAWTNGKEGPEPFRPATATVNNVLDALRAAAHLDTSTTPPTWLDGRAEPPPGETLACQNGLLHLPTRRLLPHSPAFLCTHALPFPFDPNAPEPIEFLGFLHSLWPEDDGSIQTVQEMFGYLVAGDTRQQKMFMLVGPKRGGKGTVARVIRALVGDENVAGPTLSSLATNFGMQSLIGRPLAVISDARLSGRTDETVIVERLLSITGEDVLTVDRKHRAAWIGQLPTRFLMLTNELPRLSDTSGAMAGRFVILTLSESWYGREDTRLQDRLLPELPAIFLWALEGLDRLRSRGRFNMPQASRDAVQDLEDLASPVGAFVRDCCVVEAGAEVETKTLYQRWRRWCEDHGRSRPTTDQVFGRDLRTVLPRLKTASRRQGTDRFRVYVGIRQEGL